MIKLAFALPLLLLVPAPSAADAPARRLRVLVDSAACPPASACVLPEGAVLLRSDSAEAPGAALAFDPATLAGQPLADAAQRIARVRPPAVLLRDGDSLEARYATKLLASAARAAGAEVVLLVDAGNDPAGALGTLAGSGIPAYVDALSPPRGTSFPLAAETALLEAGWPARRWLRREPAGDLLLAAAAAAAAGADGLVLVCPATCPAPDAAVPLAPFLDRLSRLDRSAESSIPIRTLSPGSRTVETSKVPLLLEPGSLASWVALPPSGTPRELSLPGRPETSGRLVDPALATETPLRRDPVHGFALPASPHALLLRLDPLPAEGSALAEQAGAQAVTPDLSAEEILARHRARRELVSSRRKSFVAENRTVLRFHFGGTAQAVELEIRGPFFWNGDEDVEWAWNEMYVNGVRWRGEKIPELPLMQPEKVATPPLSLSLGEEYRYESEGREQLRGREVWVLRFEPKPEAAGTSLFRGRAFLDVATFDLLRTEAVQVNPGAEVLSNEEILDTGFAADGLPFPELLSGQASMTTAGEVTVVERETRLVGLEPDPADFTDRRNAARASKSVMVKETGKGIRYFEPVPDAPAGTRRVRDDLSRARLFGIAGVFADDSLDYPLPLLGVNYLNFDLLGRGLQTNVFFGGAILTANLTEPHLFGTKLDLSADLFGIAVMSNDDVYADGEADERQRVRNRPFSANVALGLPLLDFWKIRLQYRFRYTAYEGDDEETDPFFLVPESGVTDGLLAQVRFDRLGWTATGEYAKYRRRSWPEWGRGAGIDWSPEDRDYETWRVSAGKEWRLPKFQRFRLEASYLDGHDLDRFSKWSFGFFGGTRVAGFKSGAIRADRMLIGSGSYGLSIAELFRLELTIDHARVSDREAGWNDRAFTGASLSGNTNGPWETILQYSVGLPLQGGEEAKGFVLYLVLLKLF